MKKNSSLIFIIFFSFLISLFHSQYSSFIIDLEPSQTRCLNEYYQIKTVVILEVTSESNQILTEIKAPNGYIIFHNMNTTSIFSYTTKHNGFANFCIENRGKIVSEVNIKIRSGISANDYSSVAKRKDLEPIDFELDKILKKESLLNHLNTNSLEKKHEFRALFKSLSAKVIFYSILLIIGMILIGVVETLYLKRFMEKRKII